MHTSGLVLSPAWMEYRFNAVKKAFVGAFTTEPGGIELFRGYVGRATPSLDEMATRLTVRRRRSLALPRHSHMYVPR